jgi:glutathione peroxidase-family protein
VAEKMKVKEEDKSPLYKWLAEENGIMQKAVAGDFHKYLISSKGTMIGYFVGSVEPMDSLILGAIEGVHYRK